MYPGLKMQMHLKSHYLRRPPLAFPAVNRALYTIKV